eukprot:Tbor_TRINITY_DN5239_c0_g2::TRINITY_DN5239_c0_g2_i1::g.16291::m.16291/K08337/ATG7; ubiquitin-like modifier-activating enzyme ATG7
MNYANNNVKSLERDEDSENEKNKNCQARSAPPASKQLKYRDYAPLIDMSFWFKLENQKLHYWRLEEPKCPLFMCVASVNRGCAKESIAHYAYLGGSAFECIEREHHKDEHKKIEKAGKELRRPTYRFVHTNTIRGLIRNFNSYQQLVDMDKKITLREAGMELLLMNMILFDWEKYDVVLTELPTSNQQQEEEHALARECSEKLTFLNAVAMYTFSELKNHDFSYVLAFPALEVISTTSVENNGNMSSTILPSSGAMMSVTTSVSDLASDTDFVENYENENNDDTTNRLARRIAKLEAFKLAIYFAKYGTTSSSISCNNDTNDDFTPFIVVPSADVGRTTLPRILPFTPNNAIVKNSIIVFNDTSNLCNPTYPGWVIRNLAICVRMYHPHTRFLNFLGIRQIIPDNDIAPATVYTCDKKGKEEKEKELRRQLFNNMSMYYECSMESIPTATEEGEDKVKMPSGLSIMNSREKKHQEQAAELKQQLLLCRNITKDGTITAILEKHLPFIKRNIKVVGWSTKSIETVRMGEVMDQDRLADSSAKLNLGLMKWRMMPNLDLEHISKCKALLIGSGTLGCNIARHLLMWGVTTLTIVDRGQVSYSNPVRQTLFVVNDAVEKRNKADAAKDMIKRILPSANVEAVNMTVRMPGHRVDPNDAEEVAQCRKDVELLERLIKSHDVIYLLTDSRESRWLPTVLATVNEKLIINTALGFDTYVAMRHGLPCQAVFLPGQEEALRKKDPAITEKALQCKREANRLGCYFCNDVVAPMDSMTARTLDQQCTVTRPGVSSIASAISVELLASLYNHPKQFAAPAYRVSDLKDEDINYDDHLGPAESVLGIIPHQIRGNLTDYSMTPMYGQYYSKCTACSDAICNMYRNDGFEFVLRCLNEPTLMEEVTGLKAERLEMEEKYANWDDDDFENDNVE